jgi:putative DNA primase/helicase
MEELPGILKWAIEGCLEWQRMGLGVPVEVKNATESYREEMDVLSAFIEECCELGPSHRTSASLIYGAYLKWCENNGEHPMTQRALGMRLAEKGFKSSRTGSTRYWEGIRVIDEADLVLMTHVTHHDASFGNYPYESEKHTNLPEEASHTSLRHRKDEDFDTWH